jgi:cobalt/nickel transport protein
MHKLRTALLALLLCLPAASAANAHFGMVIPSESTVMDAGKADVTLHLKFWHPFLNEGMNLEKPAAFTVYRNGSGEDLLPTLKEGKEQGRTVWSATRRLDAPGLYAFVMEQKPYFEKEEDRYILHYTKVYVDAFGEDDGWSSPLGLKTEIVPLTRPGALYSGNVFQGRVLLNGKPAPDTEVEIEWYPGKDKRGRAPHTGMITQTVKTDENGVFAYAAPYAGWWGFAALSDDGTRLAFGGAEKAVELGAVLWVRFYDFMSPEPLPQRAGQSGK